MKWSARDDKGLKLWSFRLMVIRIRGGKAEYVRWYKMLLQEHSSLLWWVGQAAVTVEKILDGKALCRTKWNDSAGAGCHRQAHSQVRVHNLDCFLPASSLTWGTRKHLCYYFKQAFQPTRFPHIHPYGNTKYKRCSSSLQWNVKIIHCNYSK